MIHDIRSSDKSDFMEKNIMIFDVESTSLHGEAFAVGAIVANGYGDMISRFALMSTDVAEKANDWVKENVLPSLGMRMPTCKTGKELRTEFYKWYIKHKDSCIVFSDVNYPVETNFLTAVVNDDIEDRQWNMPYPLYDVANFINVNIDRAKASNTLGLTKHHPLDDSLASYYCLIGSQEFKTFVHKLLKP